MLKASLTCLQAPPSRTQHHGDLGVDPRGDLSHTDGGSATKPADYVQLSAPLGPQPGAQKPQCGVPSRLPRQASTLLSGVCPGRVFPPPFPSAVTLQVFIVHRLCADTVYPKHPSDFFEVDVNSSPPTRG